MQQGKKLGGKQLGFLTKTCSQAQAYLGIPQTFFGSSRQSTTKIEDAPHTKKMLAGTAGCWAGVASAVRVSGRSGSGWHLRHLCTTCLTQIRKGRENRGQAGLAVLLETTKKERVAATCHNPWCLAGAEGGNPKNSNASR